MSIHNNTKEYSIRFKNDQIPLLEKKLLEFNPDHGLIHDSILYTGIYSFMNITLSDEDYVALKLSIDFEAIEY